MKTISQIMIGIGIVLGSIFSLTRRGGILCAMLLIILESELMNTKSTAEFMYYESIKDKSNPLYVKGCYREENVRKSRFIQWSDLKYIYWFQMYVIVQDIIFGIFGIITDFTGKWYIVQGFMPLLVFLTIIIREGIQSYYERILKRELQKKKKSVWPNFKSRDSRDCEKLNPDQIETIYNSFYKLESKIEESCRKREYLDWKRVLYDDMGEVYLYIRTEEGKQKVFMLIDTQKRKYERYGNIENPDALESGGIRDKLDNILKEFFAEYFGTLKPEGDIYLTVLISTESMEGYWNMVNSVVHQVPERYWIPAILSLDTGILFVGRQKKGYGLKEFEKMRKELYNMLDAN